MRHVGPISASASSRTLRSLQTAHTLGHAPHRCTIKGFFCKPAATITKCALVVLQECRVVSKL